MNYNAKKYLFIWCLGAIAYGLVEVLARGYTHWTMVITGGFALLMLYGINKRMAKRNLLLRCLAGCLAITAAEFAVGCVVNLALGWNVWDYSDEAYNLLGQICPKITAYWFLLCIPVMIGCDLFDRQTQEYQEEAM